MYYFCILYKFHASAIISIDEMKNTVASNAICPSGIRLFPAATKMNGSKEYVSWDSHQVKITLDSESYYLDVQPPGPGPGWYDQDWDRTGTTVEINR